MMIRLLGQLFRLLAFAGISVAFGQSPGVIVGTTHYDMQSAGSGGNRIAVCNDGSKYFVWTDRFRIPGPYLVYFNWVDSSGHWFSAGGDRVFSDQGSKYGQLSVIYGNRGVIAAYTGQPQYTILALDSEPPGFGIFSIYDPPDSVMAGTFHAVLPYSAVDRNNRIHLVMTASTTMIPTILQKLVYTRSADGGVSWINPVQVIDTAAALCGGVIAASPVSDKVIIAYAKPSDTISVIRNDVVYVLSQDGITWDFANGRVNITNYGSDDDSLWANFDLDVIFDYNDNFHIIWTANWSSQPNSFHYRTYLFHFNYATQQINQIRAPWPDSTWPGGCDPGGWRRPICNINLGVKTSTCALYAIWTQFDSADCSQNGFANGDIFMSYSVDDGATWSPESNLTNSHTPGCFPGECDSDNWATLADVVDDSLYIFYVNDKDAGSIPQTEGAITDNPMMYLAVRNPYTGVENANVRPTSFALAQNYPNPFNAKTIISFELKESRRVSLRVYNIIGEKVATLIEKELHAGHHEIRWDASGLASGLYFYVLSDNSGRQIKQTVLLK